MKNPHSAAAFLGLFGILAAACSSSSTPAATKPPAKPASGTAPASTTKKKVATSKLKTLDTKTPPTGAKSQGTKTRPVVAGTVVPIVNVEVFVVVLDLDDDGTDDTVNWARTTEGGLYLWTDGAVLCDDGTTDGSSGYMVQIQPDGSGADFFAYDGCQEQGTSGCTFDANGNDLVCGGCSWNETVIVCASN